MLQTLSRHDEALARFRHAAGISPDNADSRIACATSLLALCRPDEAVACLQQCLSAQPQNPEALLKLAAIHRDDQAYAEAEECLRRALEYDPRFVAAELELANLLATTGREEDAVACYERVVSIEPGNYTAIVELGTLYDRLCRPVEAERCFRQAMAHVGESLSSSLSLGAEGRDSQQRLGETLPRELVNSLGMTLADQGRLDDAIACYDRALADQRRTNFIRWHARTALSLFCSSADSPKAGTTTSGAGNAQMSGRPRDHLRAPVWDGASLAGKTILIHGEQGVGDEIMFASCYSDVIQQAATHRHHVRAKT